MNLSKDTGIDSTIYTIASGCALLANQHFDRVVVHGGEQGPVLHHAILLRGLQGELRPQLVREEGEETALGVCVAACG
jgi:hypothetical protein